VSIAETDNLWGAASFDGPIYDWRSGPKIKAANEFALAVYGGVEAERLILNSELTSDSDDHRMVEDCLAWAVAVKGASFDGDHQFEIHEARLRRRAAVPVRRHRADIERVATALTERQTLSGD
jgi:hypothetical protein